MESSSEQKFIPEDTVSPDELHAGRLTMIPSQRILQLDGIAVKIGSRAFDLLALLLERRGRIVSKEALFECAWPGMHVEEIALRVQMTVIRKATQGRANILIEAIPGMGYRLAFAGVEGRDAPPLVGRAATIAMLAAVLDERAFITIVGPGGVGKTVVALAIAERLRSKFSDGVCILDFAAERDSTRIPGLIANRLGLPIYISNPLSSIVEHLQTRSMLLVFDTSDHVIDEVTPIAEAILKGTTGIRIIVTSREPLRATGERIHRLPPLAPSQSTMIRRWMKYAIFQPWPCSSTGSSQREGE